MGIPQTNAHSRFVLVTGAAASGEQGVGLHVRLPGVTVNRAQALHLRSQVVQALLADGELGKQFHWDRVVDLQVYGSSREDKLSGSLRIFGSQRVKKGQNLGRVYNL